MLSIWIDACSEIELLLIAILINYSKIYKKTIEKLIITKESNNQLEFRSFLYKHLLEYSHSPIYNLIDKNTSIQTRLLTFYNKQPSLLDQVYIRRLPIKKDKVDILLCTSILTNIWLFAGNNMVNWEHIIVVQPFQNIATLDMVIKVDDNYLQGLDKITFMEFSRFLNKHGKTMYLISNNFDSSILLDLVKSTKSTKIMENLIEVLRLLQTDSGVMNKMLCISAIAWIFNQDEIVQKKEYCIYNNKEGLYLECPTKIKSHIINSLPRVTVVIPTKDLTLKGYKLLI